MSDKYQNLIPLKPGESPPASGYLANFPDRSMDMIQTLLDAKNLPPAPPVLGKEVNPNLALDTDGLKNDALFKNAVNDLTAINNGLTAADKIDGKSIVGVLNKNSSVKEISESFVTKASYSGISGVSVSRIVGSSYSLVTGEKDDYTDGNTKSQHYGNKDILHEGSDYQSKTTIDGNHRTNLTVQGQMFNRTIAYNNNSERYGHNTAALTAVSGTISSFNGSIGPNTAATLTGMLSTSVTAAGLAIFALAITPYRHLFDLTLLTRLDYVGKSTSAAWGVDTMGNATRLETFTTELFGTQTISAGAKLAAINTKIEAAQAAIVEHDFRFDNNIARMATVRTCLENINTKIMRSEAAIDDHGASIGMHTFQIEALESAKIIV